MKEYLELVDSKKFKDDLQKLNYHLKEKLEKCNYFPVLIGNLFYDHDQRNPPFYNSKLLDDCLEKRIRLFTAAKMKKTMFEVGLNGGHSAFLAMMSNENLTVYSNDIAEFYPPCPNIHPEIYVDAAAEKLKEFYPNNFHYIRGNCLTEVPKFTANNPNIKIDLVHIDGEKSTYRQDFFNILPLLEDDAIVIFDDSNIPHVQNVVNDLIENNYLHRSELFPQMNKNIKYTNEILIYKKPSNKTIFENIYRNHIWNGSNPTIPLSGPGSSIENTRTTSMELNYFIYKNKCNSILDIGCGDLNWISKTEFFNDDNIKYTGIDIVEFLINFHKKKFGSKNFICEDVINYEIKEKYSLIIIRDVIFHLTNDEIMKIFDNIKDKFDYIAITSCRNNVNTDIFDRWRFSEKNLHKHPFNKSYNFEARVEENVFNRDFYIFSSNNF